MDYFTFPFLLYLYCSACATWITAYDLREYCETEIFNATCHFDEVIVMQDAKYGRMRIGRCLKLNYGHVGCMIDVLQVAHGMCSGRQSCQIRIPNEALKSTPPCPDDLKMYFEASFKCLSVDVAETQSCNLGSVSPSKSAGYIANVVTKETGKGGGDCPWVIMAQPQQKLKLTLYDFSTPSEKNIGTYDTMCHAYAVVKESNKTVTICGGQERESHVYTSIGNTLELRIMLSKDDIYFLIQFEVIGCSDPDPPMNAWMKRSNDTATIVCDASQEIWHLNCVDNKWIGEVGTCTGAFANHSPGPLYLIWSIVIACGMLVTKAVF